MLLKILIIQRKMITLLKEVKYIKQQSSKQNNWYNLIRNLYLLVNKNKENFKDPKEKFKTKVLKKDSNK